MDHNVRTATITFVGVILAGSLTFAFRSQLWAYLGLAWVVPLFIAPFVAPPCRRGAHFLLNRTRIYAFVGALAGYAFYFPLSILLTPILLGPSIWVAVVISVVVAAGLSAWLAVKGCQHHSRLVPFPER